MIGSRERSRLIQRTHGQAWWRRSSGLRLAVGRERLAAYTLLIPASVLVFGFLVYPLCYTLWLSVMDASSQRDVWSFAGLRHYRDLVRDSVVWQAARNTIALVAVTAFAELVVGVSTALLLWWRFWGRAFVFLSVFVPWAFPATFSAFAWYWLLMPPFSTFYTIDLQEARWWLEGLFGTGAWQVLSIAVMNVWRGSSIIAVFVLAGLNAIPDELLDVGKLEAPNVWQYFWRVVAPLSRRFLVLAALVALVITYTEYSSMYVETGGRITVPVLGTLAFREAIQNGNMSVAAALTLLPLPFAMVLVVVCLHLLERRDARYAAREATRGEPPSRRPRDAKVHRTDSRVCARRAGGTRTELDRWRRARRWLLLGAGASAAVMVTVFHLFPVYYTAVQAVRPVTEYGLGNPFWAYAPTLEDIGEVLRNPTIWLWGRNTVVVFGAVVIIGLAVSLPAGYALARFDLPGGRWLARLMFCGYFVPPMAVVFPIFPVFARWNLDDTTVGIVLLYLTLAVPFSTWLFYMYFQGLSPDVEEHAMLDGSRTQVFLRVILPMSWPVVIAAALFSIGMMSSDVLYGSTFSLSDATKTLPVGLGLTAIQLDEWASANAAILLSSVPIITLCAALAPYYVRGLRAALIEGA